MPIIHPSRATNPRDLQAGSSFGDHATASAFAGALQYAGIPCAIHQFPEFQENWWAVCVDRKRDLAKAELLRTMFHAGYTRGVEHRASGR